LDDLRYWVGFNLVRGIGPARLRALIDYFDNLETAWNAPRRALREAGLDRRSLQSLLTARQTLNLDDEMRKIECAGITLLTWNDPMYPRLLREIYNPPPLLYMKGSLSPEDDWSVAVVGTRGVSPYGRQVAQRLATGLVRNGLTVVSGLALGVDGEAHRAALAAGGRTIAVLGGGFNHIYPSDHRHLAERIAKQGALLTEYGLDVRPEAGNFPARNRIISGLSLGTVVVEAGKQSGALITAHMAAEQGREVFAVPGNILKDTSTGCNHLIQQGAKAVLNVRDILEELNLSGKRVVEQKTARREMPVSREERQLLQKLNFDPLHVDEVSRQLNLPVAQVSSMLVLLELKGLVRQVGNMKYVRLNEAEEAYHTDDGD